MNIKYLRAYLMVCSLVVIMQPLHGLAQNSSASKTSVHQTTAERDGQRDFDPLIGSWKVHWKRRLHPLTGSTTWVEFDGVDVYRKIWDGRANFDEIEIDSSSGHIEGSTLRLYNPQTHQWSIYWANSKNGKVTPPNVGEFKDGQGEFYTQDTLDGRLRYNRYIWSKLTTNSPHFEESWSDDGGKTWEVDGIADMTRVSHESVKAYVPAVTPTESGGAKATAAERDGQHDFDFEVGRWNIHLKRLQDRLAGSTTWIEFDGTSATRKVWDGRADLEEFETDSSAGGRIEGLTLRLYNPQTHQWSLYWANSKNGIIDPPQIGQFKNGRGEFYGQDTWNGKPVIVRFVWTNTTTNTPHFEQSYSDDGGKTWEVNWITDQTRVSDEAGKAPAQQNSEAVETGSQQAVRDGQHDFDFYFGNWKSHLSRRLHPLTGSTNWVEFDGTIATRKVWDGRANLNEFEAEGPTGHIEGLTLRLYDPQTHQWRLYWANSKEGTLGGPPMVGEFKNGRGEFYAQDTLGDRVILVRYVWSDITPNSAHFEQSYSGDGGKTWEANWISTMTKTQNESDNKH